jgi:very-short-patch-repair endonuclease
MTTPSTPEILVAEWLYRHKIPFNAQENMLGGATESGGARIDFYITESNIIIRVQSYWHTIPGAMAKDVMQKIALINEGYLVVDVWENRLTENPDLVMRAALQGRELGE